MLEVSAQSSVKIVPFPYSVVFKQKKDLHFFFPIYVLYLHRPQRDSATRFSTSGFLWISFPKPLSIQFGGEAMATDRGSLYRSTGQNINGPNINELQINCSIDQQNPILCFFLLVFFLSVYRQIM